MTKTRAADDLRRYRDIPGTVSAKELVQAETDYASATAREERLKATLQILKEGPRKEKVTASEADVKAAEAQVRAAEARLVQARWRLENCVLYVNLEPCPMCAGAIVLARLPMIVYGATDPKAGACDTVYRITSDARLNHRAQVVSGVLADRCAGVLSEFFAAKRRPR